MRTCLNRTGRPRRSRIRSASTHTTGDNSANPTAANNRSAMVLKNRRYNIPALEKTRQFPHHAVGCAAVPSRDGAAFPVAVVQYLQYQLARLCEIPADQGIRAMA